MIVWVCVRLFGAPRQIPLVQTTGRSIDVEIVDPLPYIYAAAGCERYANMLRQTHDKTPCSVERPWRVILYSDEARPGNKIKQWNKRSMECIYLSFLEIGPAFLAKEDFWLCIGAIKATDVENCRSGMAQVMSKILHRLFQENGCDLRFSGCNVDLPDGSSIRIIAKLGVMLGDESALHAAWNCKGSGGTKPCCQCLNIVSDKWTAVDELDGSQFLKNISTIYSLDECALQSRETIFAILDDLDRSQPPVLNIGDFKAKEQRLGWNYSPYNILKDPWLREVADVPSQNCFDWAHNILQGIFQLVIYLAMRDISSSGIKARHVESFLVRYIWPRRVSTKGITGVEMFCTKRATSSWKAQAFKCSCSEALSIHLALAHYFRSEVQPTGQHEKTCKVVKLLALLIQMLWYGPKLGISAAKVGETTTMFIRSFVDAYGAEWLIWKFHAILHHSQYIARWGWSPNTIALERKHKQILRWGEDHQKDCSSVIRDVLAQSLHNLKDAPWLDMSIGLVLPRQPPKRFLEFLVEHVGPGPHLTSGKARYSEFDVCWVGDVVAHARGANWAVARVKFLASYAGCVYAAIQPFECTWRGPWHSRWQSSGGPCLIEIRDFLEVLIHKGGDEDLTVLHPLGLVS